MTSAGLQHVKLERNVDVVQVRLVCGQEVDAVANALARADSNVERVHNGLLEVLLHRRLSHRTQIDAVEAVLVPEARLVELLRVQSLVCRE